MPDPKPLLIVEDDDETRMMLSMYLQTVGYPVCAAADGSEGLSLARAHRPSLILLDLMMPRVSGPQFRQEQLRDPAIAHIPVVVVSAHADAETIARRLGAVACLCKPMAFDRLMTFVERYCTA